MTSDRTSLEGRSTSVAPSRARVLMQVSEGDEAQGSVARPGISESRSQDPGPSAKRLARAISTELDSGWSEHDELIAWSMSLTTTDGDRSTVEVALRRYLDALTRKWPRASALLALDVADRRWHAHGLLLAPARVTPSKLLRTWTHLWPSSGRPRRDAAQAARVVACVPGTSRPLLVHVARVLEHALLRRDADVWHEWLADRVYACGALGVLWRRNAARLGVRGVRVLPTDREPSRDGKAVAVPSQPVERHAKARRGVTCGWCGGRLESGSRPDSRWHSTCGPSARRALATARAKAGSHAALLEEIITRLESKGWLRPWAIGEARKLAPHGRSIALFVLDACQLPPRCRCGKPLSKRSGAATCGGSACRPAAARRRERDAEIRERTKPMNETARLARLAWTLDDETVTRPTTAAERRRLLALADFLANAEPPCPIEHVPLESDPLIGRWLVTLSPDEVERFEERAAIIEEGADVDRERAEALAFSELEPRFATKHAA